MTGDELRAAFLAARPTGAAAASASLASDLEERAAAGKTAWPSLALGPAVFARHLAEHAEDSLPPAKYAADMWLACACATGVPGAADAFTKAHGETVQRAAERVSRPLADEIAQQVMVSLFVAEPGERPRIAEYGGRAALRTWLATVTSNAALNRVQRRDNQPYESVAAVNAAAIELSPELAIAKARYGAELDAALKGALAALDNRRRVLLRLHHVQGWTMDRLATMYRVSRSAAGRLVVEARTALLEDTKRRLVERLSLTPTELESLVAVLQSDLQVSLVRMLELNE